MLVVLTMLNGLMVVGIFLACAGIGSALFTQFGLTENVHYPSTELTMLVGLASAALLLAGRKLTSSGATEHD